MKKRILAVVLATMMLMSMMMTSASAATAGSNAFAMGIGSTNQISIQQLKDLKNDILDETQQETEDFHYMQVIENVDLLRDELVAICPQISDFELGKNILLALGDSEEFITTLPEEKVLEAVQYTSVVIDEVYLHELEDGEMVQISKERFYEPDVTQKAANLPDFEQTFGDIVLRTKAYKRAPSYALPGRNYWAIRGEVEWVGFPNFQQTDLLVIASTGNIDNQYDHYAHGRWTHPLINIEDTGHLYDKNGGDGNYLSLSTPDLYGMGIKFPLGVWQQNQVTIEKVYAYYGISSQSDISAQVSYAHAIIAWNPSFSVNTKGAVSFGGLSAQRQVFNGDAFTLYYE